MPAHHPDIEVVAGDDWAIPANLLDANGIPLDLTNASFDWTFVDPTGAIVTALVEASDIIVGSPASGGQLQITIPRVQTEPLLPGRYHDSLRVIINNQTDSYWVGNILVDGDPFSLIPPL